MSTATDEKTSNENLNPHRELAPPLTAYGTCALWNVNGYEFYQLSPATTDPYKEVAPFVQAAVELARSGKDWSKTMLTVPGYRDKQVGGKPSGETMHIQEPVSRIMAAFWPEVSRTPPKRNAKVAYEWRIWWSKHIFDASFRRYDAAGEIVALHDIVRMPFDDLIEHLGASNSLRELSEVM